MMLILGTEITLIQILTAFYQSILLFTVKKRLKLTFFCLTKVKTRLSEEAVPI